MARGKTVCDCGAIHQDILDKVAVSMPDRDFFNHLAALYKAFSDPTRATILWALGNHEMCVCDLAALLNMTKSAISHQLKTLRLSNLVQYKREGKVMYYSLADSHVSKILACGSDHVKE
ncbi:MAG: metalloregulator ArsR/SmtB family transcription factor [Planctomycetota bacterium]|jgi:ArsR family transcriptional regulator|nr:metalloregulator ArsR/SmtB family transcription factor [Planctomycetota bacterium]